MFLENFEGFRWAVLTPESAVRVVFSDDTGRGSVRDEPLTVVAAVMLNPDTQWEPVVTEFTAAIIDAVGRRANVDEVKGNRLLKDATEGKVGSARLLERILSLPKRHNIPIFYGAVDRRAYDQHKDYLAGYRRLIHELLENHRQDAAFYDCLRRVDTYTSTLVPRERVLWIADAGGNEQKAKKFELAWRRFMERFQSISIRILEEAERTGRDFNDLSTELWARIRVSASGLDIQPETSHVIETIFFGDSAESRCLQLADVCCSVINAHLLRARGAEYYELIRPQIVNDGTPPAFTSARPWFS